MDAYDYCGFVKRCRKELVELWNPDIHPLGSHEIRIKPIKIEPVFTSLFVDSNSSAMVHCFIHPNDKNKSTIKSLKYAHREL